MTRLAIVGAGGRMGRVLYGLIGQRDDCCVAAGVDRYPLSPSPEFPIFETVSAMVDAGVPVDVVIDFSHPDATRKAVEVCTNAGLPIVVCTTGLPEDTQAQLQQAAIQIPLFHSANMSLGINLLAELARRAASALPGFDIEIIEKHHHNKLDAPSGTALLLADEINRQAGGRYHYQYNRHPLRQKRDPDEIGIHAVRGGSIVGEHEVLLAGPDETLTLAHSAASRDVFAGGAISAALFLAGRAPGLYTMRQLLEESLCME